MFSLFSRRHKKFCDRPFSLLTSNWESMALQRSAQAWLWATPFLDGSYSPTLMSVLTLSLCLIVLGGFVLVLGFFHIKCVHGSSPQLTLCTLKILDISCLQIYLFHLLTLTRTFFPSVSPLSHGTIGTVDYQLIPDNLFICVEHHAILQCE